MDEGTRNSFWVVTLTADTYRQLVREACASLRMPYRVREEKRIPAERSISPKLKEVASLDEA